VLPRDIDSQRFSARDRRLLRLIAAGDGFQQMGTGIAF
jgi:hypothetical protein